MEGSDESRIFKKTISTSTEFLRNIWHTWDNLDNEYLNDTQQRHSRIPKSNEVKSKRSKTASNIFFGEGNQTDNAEYAAQDKSRQLIRTKKWRSLFRENDFKDAFQRTKTSIFGGNISMKDPNWTPESLITEAFLDKTLVSEVQDKKRLSYFYMQSRVLYKYLSYHIGSETMIDIRRKIMEAQYSRRQGLCGIPMQISGSRAEGLAMAGSDTDIMVFGAEAYEGKCPTPDFIGLVYDSLEYNEQPGYVTVLQVFEHEQAGCFRSSDMKTFGTALFSCMNFLVTFFSHGPAMSSSCFGHDVDIVSCLKSPAWPNIAKEWIHRKRIFGWPSTKMVSNIVSQGCHIVPVSGKLDQHVQIDGQEWRLSFSMAEKLLIRSFSHVQILIYGLFKLLLKEIIEKEEKLKNVLCSYFLKTTLFWLIEETNVKLWDSKYTILCFSLCLERLIGYVVEENCPNYFVPINNMFQGRFTESQKEVLLDLLCNIYDQGLKWNIHSATMLNLSKYMKDPYTVCELHFFQKMKEKKEKVELLLTFIRMCKSQMALIPTHHKILGSYLKSTLRIPIINLSTVHYICHFINTNKYGMSNKHKYACKQTVLSLILHGSEMDRISKYLMLASWLYVNGKFHDCFRIIDDLQLVLNSRVFHCGAYELSVFPRLLDDGADVYQILKFYSTMNFQLPMSSNIAPYELSYIAQGLLNISPFVKHLRNNSREWSLNPEQYLYFLKCLCYIKFGDDLGYNDALKELDNIQFIGSERERTLYMIENMVLRVVVQVTKRGEKDFNCIILEEAKILSCSSNYNNIKDNFVSQGLNPDVDHYILNSLQTYRHVHDIHNQQ